MDNTKESIYNISELLLRFKDLESRPLKKVENWQTLALKIIKETGAENKGSVFKCCKIDSRAALFALNDCRELNKLHINYFFKVWGALHYGPNRTLQTK